MTEFDKKIFALTDEDYSTLLGDYCYWMTHKTVLSKSSALMELQNGFNKNRFEHCAAFYAVVFAHFVKTRIEIK